MRISDWSSDVCSSDLEAVCQIALFSKVTGVIPCASGGNGAIREDDNGNSCNAERTRFDPAGERRVACRAGGGAGLGAGRRRRKRRERGRADRKSGAEGKSVAVRGDPGGRRSIKKKKKK